MEQGEIGAMVEAEEEKNNAVDNADEVEEYNDTISSLRRSCVSKSSIAVYTNALVKILLWMHHVSLSEEYIGYDPLSEYWKNSLTTLRPDARKKWIKLELHKSENAPINFESFEPGKHCQYDAFLFYLFYLILIIKHSIRVFSLIHYVM